MGLHLDWVVKCCRCNKEERVKARTLNMIIDSDPVKVSLPELPEWETDGLGGWMCKSCYKDWLNKSKELPMLFGQEVRNLEADQVDLYTIPNGTYLARVTGYTAIFKVGDIVYNGRIDHGIRGTSACTVVVKDGKITIGE